MNGVFKIHIILVYYYFPFNTQLAYQKKIQKIIKLNHNVEVYE